MLKIILNTIRMLLKNRLYPKRFYWHTFRYLAFELP